MDYDRRGFLRASAAAGAAVTAAAPAGAQEDEGTDTPAEDPGNPFRDPPPALVALGGFIALGVLSPVVFFVFLHLRYRE